MMNFFNPKRLEVGANSFDRLGEFVKSIGGNKVLVIMDAFLASPQMGLNKKVTNILSAAGLDVSIYSGIANEPTFNNIAEGVDAAKKSKCDCIVALGGGSSIDSAKAVATLAVNPNLAFSDIPKEVNLKRLPLIAVPTTSGTGSEATRVSVITNETTGIKENPGHPALIPDIAVLDPQLSLTLPASLTASTGMDALTHAIEAFVSNKANSLSDLYAKEAIKIIGENLIKVFTDGNNLEQRQKMSIASYLAGVAFSNASTNLAHAGGRALGAYFHIPHGLSVALLLPFVMEFGLDVAEDRYAQVALLLGANPHLSQIELALESIKIINDYNQTLEIWNEAQTKYITDLATFRKAIPEMVDNSLSGNGILTNPRIPNKQDITLVFEKLAEKLSD
ncbi:iron-containing alcohol dehydrogenase family protein [Desulfitobacterium sp. AusDCA]|uniref:iron-containing alcohol dehydrogenase family protein n=1 Tax=Desulfitobacterium sp. AusDCA TaxID=3240383 RepID=UPI003DA79DB9